MRLFANGLRDDLTPRDYFMMQAVAGLGGDPRDYYELLREHVSRVSPGFESYYALQGRRRNGLE